MVRIGPQLGLLGVLVAAAMTFAACEEEGSIAGAPTPPPEATVTDSGLQIVDITVGDGAEATADSTITAHYTLFFLDGTRFQSSLDTGQPLTQPLSGLIPGWQEGIPGMKEGGKRKLVVPPELGYGANPRPDSGIPPNAWLIFEMELLAVQ